MCDVRGLHAQEGVIPAFYSGFGPILLKQVPYTMAKFAVQGMAAEKIYDGLGKTPEMMSKAGSHSGPPLPHLHCNVPVLATLCYHASYIPV